MIASSSATRKKRRVEAKVIQNVRTEVAERDGFCRLACKGVGPCQGQSEWCHFGAFKRFKTRGMKPEVRHTTAGSFQGCTRHHQMYDQHQVEVEALTADGCDGPLQIRIGTQIVFRET